MSTGKKIILIVLTVFLFLLIAAFAAFWLMFPWIEQKPVWYQTESYVSGTVTKSDIDSILKLKSPKLLDLLGSDLEEGDIARLEKAFPDCVVLWSVPINGQKIDCREESLRFTHATEEDLERLRLFPNLKSIRVTESDCYDALRKAETAYPGVSFSWTVEQDGITLERDVEELDVKDPVPLETLTKLLAELDRMKQVTLTSTHLSNAETKELMERFPSIHYTYSVHIGDLVVSPDLGEIGADLMTGIHSAKDIADALPYLPNLKKVDLEPLMLSNAQLAEAIPMLEGLELHYNVVACGQRVDPATEALKLTNAGPEDVAAVSEAVLVLPKLKSITLDGWKGTLSELSDFVTGFDSLSFTYSFEYQGIKLDYTSETADLHGKKIEDHEMLYSVIRMLPNLTKVDMVDCGWTDEQMAELSKTFPAVKFVWEIDLGFWGKLRTDAIAFTTRSSKEDDELKYRLTTETVQPIQYCTDLVALDLGHQRIEDISCLANLKKLQILILADNRIEDISALASMPDLIYVELFMNKISDLSPLSGLTKIKDLNLCTNNISDLKPLYSLSTLERLWYSNNKYTKKDHDALQAVLVNCKCNRTVWQETDDGWRTHERYFWMRSFFENSPRYKK